MTDFDFDQVVTAAGGGVQPVSVIESQRYKDEEARLKDNAAIIKMAAEIWVDAFDPLAIVNDNLFITHAYNEAKYRGVEFETIGGPARAIRAIINDWRIEDEDRGPA